MAEIPRLETADGMISGSEWETTIYIDTPDNPNGRAPVGHECSRLIRASRPDWRAVRNGTINHYLENGGILYIDGNRIEIGTPEEATPEGAVQRELDDEWFITRMMQNAAADPEGGLVGAAAYKRTYSSGRRLVKKDDGTVHVDGYEGAESCGRHLNTGLPRVPGLTGIGRQYLGPMGLHIATNGLYLGSGAVFAHDPSGVNARFGLHQRAPFISTDYSYMTIYDRPVVNTRDESLAPDVVEWVRHHDINADACLSPWAMRMAHGTNRLVLRLGLAGESLEQYEPSQATPLDKIFRQTAFDMTHKKTVELWNGTITPLQIQEVLFEKCNALRERYELCQGELWTLMEWERALEDFAKDPRLLYDRTDWIMKYRTLRNYQDKNGIPENSWTDPMLEVIDADFSLLKPGSRGMKMRTGPWAKWLPSTEIGRTEEQRRTPPQDTRARIRGEAVRQYGALPCDDYKCHGCANCSVAPKNLRVGWITLTAKGPDDTEGDRARIAMRPFDTDTSVLKAIAAVGSDRDKLQVTQENVTGSYPSEGWL